MIGDGHYLNTILELGPTPLATAVRLETTLMRREMMGQPATPSPFINSDKMVSTLSRNAQQPPSTSTFSQSATHSAFVYTRSLYPTCLLAPHTFVLWDTYTVPGALQSLHLILDSPTRAFLISCPCLCSACLRGLCEWVAFVLANLLLCRRLTPSETVKRLTGP